MVKRCPYHVKQGMVDTEGNLVLSDVCGVKSACGVACHLAPFEASTSYSDCPRFVSHMRGTSTQVVIPKNDIEYLPEVHGFGNFSETDYL